MGKGLNIMYWNVRSLLNKLDSIKQEIVRIKPDVLNISESWLHVNIEDDEIHIDGYNLVRQDRGNQDNGIIKKGGGLCTYVKQGIVFDNMTITQQCDVDLEMIGIKIKLPFTRDIFVLNVYRPPSGNLNSFIKSTQAAIIALRNNRENDIFIGGDINVDMLHSNSVNAKKIQKFIKTNQVKQLIQKITRPDSNTCLDIILTDCDFIKDCGIENINISDHLPIFCIRKKVKAIKSKTEFNGRSYKELNVETLQAMLDEHDWNDIVNMNVDVGWEIMIDRIKNVIDLLCPVKTFKFSDNKPKRLTNDIILLMRERDRCLRKFTKSRLEQDEISMRKARNLSNLAVKNAKSEYIKEQLETYKNDPKKFWKHIASIIPNKKSIVSQNFNNIHDDNNDIITQENLAEHVNYYFSDIGLKLDELIPRYQHVTHQQVDHDIDLPIDMFQSITEVDLLIEINKISIYKSSGIMNVPSYLLKLCLQKLVPYLLVIMNKSLFNGYFPKLWRKAIVVPIPKIANPSEIGDLRPIALTPIPGKILERFVHIQLLFHLDQYNILTEFQNGFRKNHSTIDTIFRYTTDLQINKNNKINTISLYVDFKKAFDTVNHNLLIKKLENFNIKNKAINWIRSYLTGRTQQTQIGDRLSNEREVKTGVPQGSILGPIFFICYINDIFKSCKNSQMLLYADDTVMYKKISDNQRFLDMHEFQQDVNRLIKWCQVNRLNINVKKTKLVFHPHSQNVENNLNDVITISNDPVGYVNTYL